VIVKHNVLGVAVAALLLTTGFRNGWTRVTTDFPNYYTAAAAVRQGLPLRAYYDWTWFQREMNYTGTERQLGAYTPQTPLALLPFLPLSGMAPQQAKRVWLTMNAIFLAGTAILLASAAGISYGWLFLILLAAYYPLYANFLLGQYYVFLAFLLTLSVWLLLRGRQAAAGVLLGIVFALKLYSGPFILFFLAKRYWKAAAAMGIAIAALAIVSAAMFGLDANLFYVRSILPGAMSGMLIDPFNPGQGSMTALLRRTFVAEPGLNPHPWMDAPSVFLFLRTLFTVGILAVAVLALRQARELGRREMAWLTIAMLLLSPVNATYVFALLIVPVALLVAESSLPVRAGLLAGLALAGAPLPPAIQPWFPRVWILLALFFQSDWPGLRSLPRRQAAIAAGLVMAVSLGGAWRAPQPGPGNVERVVLPVHTLAAVSPAVTSHGLIYQAFGKNRYVLRTGAAEYEFAGHAFHPAGSPQVAGVVFELVANGHSRILRFNPDDRSMQEIAGAERDGREPCVSSDGRLAAFVSRGFLYVSGEAGVRELRVQGDDPSFLPDGSGLVFARAGQIFSVDLESGRVLALGDGGRRRHPAISPDGSRLAYVDDHEIWVQRLPSGARTRLTRGACDNDSPVWEGDSRHVVFTSDCGRGLGLPVLYRATL
jgi:hypothetical protein